MVRVFEERASAEESSAGLGALYLGDGRCSFRVWAPRASRVDLHLHPPGDEIVPMDRKKRGYHEVTVEGVEPGSLYLYRLEGTTTERPDPASRSQPHGVHGPSQVVDPGFPWQDESWFGLPLRDYIIYELHTGTFTQEGTFEALLPHIAYLADLGITAVELMPVAQFPGDRNWGYDGVYPFAAQNSYGGPLALKRLVNACHQARLAVVLDVVYNHLGPEGNYLGDFGPYFTERYKTPWGPALNFDGPESDEVRNFFIENALSWIRDFHIDALRLDALHAILDHSAQTFLEDLSLAVREEAERLNRRVYLIAESALNDSRLVRSRDLGGYGLDAQWSDDFHHSLHVLLTGEQNGYYQDFAGIDPLAKALEEGFVYSGRYSPYHRRRHGGASRDIPAERFVVFTQNHDQAGNRMRGERMSRLISFEGLKLAAGALLLSPFIPLLFMGEEYGEEAPFPYFISHSDPALIDAVRKGRREEFSAFQWRGELPDPQSESTFGSAKLRHDLRQEESHRLLLDLHKELIRLRKESPALTRLSKEQMRVKSYETEMALFLRRWSGSHQIFAAFSFHDAPTSITLPVPAGRWQKLLDSAESRWRGKGTSVPMEIISRGEVTVTLSPLAFVLFVRARRG